MQIYDVIHCNYDLGPGFWNKDLQTEDIGGCLGEYWLDNSGRLWAIDYTGTHSFEENTFKPISNGNHGKVRPYFLSKTIEVCPLKWNAHYAPYPKLSLLFLDGKLCTKT